MIPSDGTTQAPYCHIINKYAAHPNAAKLFREYILTDEAQILQAQKYARPLVKGVEIPADLAAKFPPRRRSTTQSSRSRTGRPRPTRSPGSRPTGRSRSAPDDPVLLLLREPRPRRPPGGGDVPHAPRVDARDQPRPAADDVRSDVEPDRAHPRVLAVPDLLRDVRADPHGRAADRQRRRDPEAQPRVDREGLHERRPSNARS